VLDHTGVVRATLVPLQAGPLAGDADTVRIEVGAGARVRVEPVAATVALPGPATTRLRTEVVVGAGGRLVLDEGPLVVAAGATVERRVDLTLGPGAVAVVRDVVVLGRHGEAPGRLDAVLRAAGPDGVLLHDALRLGPASAAGHARVALDPGERVVGAVALLGAAPADGDEDAVMALAAGGALRRAAGRGTAAVDAALECVWAAWTARALAA
jgi:urease accessory protein